MAGGKEITVGYRYFAGMHLGVCYGPVDKLVAIRVGDKQAWPGDYPDGNKSGVFGKFASLIPSGATAGPITSSQRIFVNAPGLHGGEQREGGVEGYIDVMFGESSQQPNDYLMTKILGAGGTVVAPPSGSMWYVNAATTTPPWETATGLSINGHRILILGVGTGSFAGHDNEVASWSQQNAVWTFEAAPAVGQQVQIINSNTVYQWSGTAWSTVTTGMPGFRQLFSLVLRQCYVSALNPYIKPWSVIATRIQAQTDGSAQWYSTKAECPANSGWMNPAHMIREALTNKEWGRGEDPAYIDNTSFTACADTLFTEGFGLTYFWSQKEDVSALIERIKSHIDAELYKDTTTSKYVLKLIRDDYDPSTIPVFDQTNILSVEECSRPTPAELPNSLNLTYYEESIRMDVPLTFQNVALIEANSGKINEAQVDRTMISSGALAAKVAARDLRALSLPLLRATMVTNRAGASLNLGDVFKWNWPEDGIENVIMRVTHVSYGTLMDGRVKVSAMEDIFALPQSVYLAPQPSGWTDPRTPPAAASLRKIMEAPYYTVIKEIAGETDTAQAELIANAGFLMTAAAKPSSDSISYTVQDSPNNSTFTDQGYGEFAPYATVVAALDKVVKVFSLQDGVNLNQVSPGSYALIDDELVGVDSLDVTNYSITVKRAVLDTVPATHAAGAKILFIESGHFVDDTDQRMSGETWYVKLLSSTPQGILKPSLAPTDTYVFTGRKDKPYPPGNVAFNGVYWPTETTGLQTVTWATRNRLTQTASLVDGYAGNVTSEAGVTYNLRLYNATTNVLMSNNPGLTGTSFIIPVSGQYTLRMELEAVRAGVVSFQKHVHQWLYIKDPLEITTEAGDPITNESGVGLITE